MELSYVILGIVLLLVFVGPMFYLVINQSAGEKKKLKKLTLLSQKNQLSLDETEILSPVSLGLDKTSKKLVVIQQAKPRKELALDLKELQSCKVVKLTAGNSPSEGLDETLEINLLLKKASGAEECIHFYQDEHDSAAEKERLLSAANRWQGLIAASIKK